MWLELPVGSVVGVTVYNNNSQRFGSHVANGTGVCTRSEAENNVGIFLTQILLFGALNFSRHLQNVSITSLALLLIKYVSSMAVIIVFATFFHHCPRLFLSLSPSLSLTHTHTPGARFSTNYAVIMTSLREKQSCLHETTGNDQTPLPLNHSQICNRSARM